jgi:hypothetical protein
LRLASAGLFDPSKPANGINRFLSKYQRFPATEQEARSRA